MKTREALKPENDINKIIANYKRVGELFRSKLPKIALKNLLIDDIDDLPPFLTKEERIVLIAS